MLPIERPSKIVCVGLNYKAHVDEGVYDVPDYPVLFTKFAESLVGAGAPVLLPPESEAVDFEAELAFVIGRHVRRTSSLDAIAGYTVANDVSMRDYQYKTHQWLPGKAWARSTPLGPYLVTPDEVGDPAALEMRLEVNGTLRQRANTSQMVYGLPRLIADLSDGMTLLPGDVIATGTTAGLAPLADGDVMRASIERLGTLQNPVRFA